MSSTVELIEIYLLTFIFFIAKKSTTINYLILYISCLQKFFKPSRKKFEKIRLEKKKEKKFE